MYIAAINHNGGDQNRKPFCKTSTGKTKTNRRCWSSASAFR